MPGLGSGPFDNTSGTGFFSVGDYTEILHYAKIHHIDVIPEFDMPGHSRAAIRSIHAKSQQSHRSQMPKAEIYRIIDELDSSAYKSGQNFRGNVLNPCMNTTYLFIDKVITEVMGMHKPVQPLTMFHFGGDEVADNAWNGSKECKKFMEKYRGNFLVFTLTHLSLASHKRDINKQRRTDQTPQNAASDQVLHCLHEEKSADDILIFFLFSIF